MAFFFVSCLAILSFFLCFWKNNRNSIRVNNWPFLGMLPGLLHHLWSLQDHIVEIMHRFGGTFYFIGPWFLNFDYLVTCDPANVNHILIKNFSNYEKGSEFKEIFEPLGDGLFAQDSDSWRLQRKMIQAMINNRKFELYLSRVVHEKVTKCLVPFLEHFARKEMEVDLQDVFQRFTFDNVCLLVLGFDPKCLSVELLEVSYEKAFDDMGESILYRHVVPKPVWKFQRWLQIGEEKTLKIAMDRFDEFLYDCISKSKKVVKLRDEIREEEVGFDLLTAIMVGEGGSEQLEDFMKTDIFLRDMAFSLMLAGRDTVKAGLSWFFYLVEKHPLVERKILEEIKSELPEKEDVSIQLKLLSTKDLMNKFIYLHAVICEALRLYPPLPINERTAVEADTLPTGQKVEPKTKILIPFYAMARMPDIWGKDCDEFKPERWISEKGSLIYVPAYKFSAFNAGPRTCLGRDMSYIQMKMVAIMVLWNYQIRIVEGHTISPKNSIILSMANGFKVRLTKRCVNQEE
ncbi:hypothetical protein ACFE04_005932 [Oxalis oulophora]